MLPTAILILKYDFLIGHLNVLFLLELM